MSLARCAGGLLAVGLFSACPGSLENPERFYDAGPGTDGGVDAGPVVCEVEALPDGGGIFKASCGGPGCHESPGPASGLDLVSAGVKDRLRMGKGTAACAMLPLAELTLEKVKPSPSCGSQMPLGQNPLSAREIKCLEDYLAPLKDGGM